MNVSFKEFPASYRWAQSGIGFALVVLALGGMILRLCPDGIKTIVLSMIGLLIVGCLILSHYVIIRYPYISLVLPNDGDPFSTHFASAGSRLYTVLKFIGLVCPAVIALAIALAGFRNLASQITFVYCILLFLFMLFFTFIYEPVRHPTITTFVRSTLGLGIPLYPIYAVTIMIGSWRCGRALDTQLPR